jgi:hypothetical protein
MPFTVVHRAKKLDWALLSALGALAALGVVLFWITSTFIDNRNRPRIEAEIDEIRDGVAFRLAFDEPPIFLEELYPQELRNRAKEQRRQHIASVILPVIKDLQYMMEKKNTLSSAEGDIISLKLMVWNLLRLARTFEPSDFSKGYAEADSEKPNWQKLELMIARLATAARFLFILFHREVGVREVDGEAAEARVGAEGSIYLCEFCM